MTNLEESPQFFEQSIELIEQSFQYQKKFSYKDDFSILYSDKNLKNCFILVDKEQVVANACTLPRVLTNGEFETPVCFIGGLCSHEKIRGRGIFKDFFNEVLNQTKDQYSLIMLWSQLSDFYNKFEFYEAGKLYEYGQSQLKDHQFKEFQKATTLTNEDMVQIARLYKKAYTDLFIPKRSQQDWENLFNHKSIELFIEKKDNEIQNYFFVNKGMDLNNIIHESSRIISEKTRSFSIWSPFFAEEATKKYLSFIKLQDNTLLKEFILEISNHNMEIIKIENQTVFFKFNDESFHIPLPDFITGIFGPSEFKEFSDFKSGIWIPGYESV